MFGRDSHHVAIGSGSALYYVMFHVYSLRQSARFAGDLAFLTPFCSRRSAPARGFRTPHMGRPIRRSNGLSTTGRRSDCDDKCRIREIDLTTQDCAWRYRQAMAWRESSPVISWGSSVDQRTVIDPTTTRHAVEVVPLREFAE
jgi:hypothetical protein